MRIWRHYFVLGLFLLAVGALSTRVVFLGVTERDFLQQEGDARSIRRESIPALRGVIYDRNGEAGGQHSRLCGLNQSSKG